MMNTLSLWLLVTVALVPLTFATKGIPSYSVGSLTRNSKYAFKGTLHQDFNTGGVVIHFNTCNQYRFKVNKIVLTTHSQYESVHAHLVAGGIYDFFFGLKVTGKGLTFYDIEVWVTWRGTIVTVEEAFVLKEFKMYHPCAKLRPTPPSEIDQ
uniref:Uncharacterized protein n=1 Tax=Graphocephala atropunctata TaxID=36148 RepID=A0A1B6MNY7_9HEMI